MALISFRNQASRDDGVVILQADGIAVSLLPESRITRWWRVEVPDLQRDRCLMLLGRVPQIDPAANGDDESVDQEACRAEGEGGSE